MFDWQRCLWFVVLVLLRLELQCAQVVSNSISAAQYNQPRQRASNGHFEHESVAVQE